MWLLFYVPVMVFYLFSVVVTVFAVTRLRKGLRETIRARAMVLTRERDCVVVFLV